MALLQAVQAVHTPKWLNCTAMFTCADLLMHADMPLLLTHCSCRRYKQYTHLPDFQVASEEDAEAMVKSILDNEKFRQQLGYSRVEQQDKKVKDEVAYYRKNISNIKNFCVNIDW
jgi:hypothetical protein